MGFIATVQQFLRVPPEKRQYSTFANLLAEMMYCLKVFVAVQTNNILELVRPPGDGRPQRLGQSSAFANYAKTKGQYSTFARFLADMLYCSKG